MSIRARTRLGSITTKNSTRTCLPRMSAEAAAKEIATTWDSMTMSMTPKTGRRKSLAPMTSMQVTIIIIKSPASAIHSNQLLSRRLNLSSFSNADIVNWFHPCLTLSPRKEQGKGAGQSYYHFLKYCLRSHLGGPGWTFDAKFNLLSCPVFNSLSEKSNPAFDFSL